MTQPFTIYVMQSAHTDIGYTHPQEQIKEMYLDHYDLVLALCRKTADAPLEHRFKWTCETFWQVEHYLAHRPERRDEFIEYVRSGQIEVTAAYLHYTDLIDPDAYHRGLARAAAFCQENQIPLRCVLHCDINGWPWSIPDSLSELNIPFFCSQVHIDSGTDPLGRRGSVHYQWLLEQSWVRKDAPIRLPQAFWWEGAGGKRVLHWLNEHYLLGNILGISSPQSFGADKTRYFYETDHASVADLYAVASREVPRYVERLKAEGYTRPDILISTGGFYVDNSPPDHRWCGVIERWNARHQDVVMRTVTLGEWFDVLSAYGTDQLPIYRAAWPDHWAHGLGSETARIAQARRTQRRRAGIVKLVSEANSESATRALERALDQERFAVEHTFDAWSTTARPEASVNAFQQIIKETTFHRADFYLTEAGYEALHALAPAASGLPTLYIYAEQPEAVQIVHFDAGDTRLDPTVHALQDSVGHSYPIQHDFARLRQFVAALPTARPGLNSFSIVPQPTSDQANLGSHTGSLTLSTDAWRLKVDPKTGGLASLVEGKSNREWVDASGTFGFGHLVHELVVHPMGRDAVGNIARMIALDTANEETRRRFAPGPIVEHTVPTFEGKPLLQPGPVFDSISMTGNSDRLGAITSAWRLYHALPVVELVIDWHKRWSDLPEAAYVAFPFAAPQGTLELETSGGFFRPGDHGPNGQLPGTCSSYYTIQRAARISDRDRLLWLPLDAPLVMPNEINYNRWETEPYAWNGFIASMPVNHYWHTNFPTSQNGYIRLRYRLISAAAYPDTEAALRAALPHDAVGWR
ncbi:MAG: glycoside hydrolase family 38 N-terminal domain-containing protein [Aggregatilineales bacterium]